MYVSHPSKYTFNLHNGSIKDLLGRCGSGFLIFFFKINIIKMTQDCHILYSPEQFLQGMKTCGRFWHLSKTVFRNIDLATSSSLTCYVVPQ